MTALAIAIFAFVGISLIVIWGARIMNHKSEHRGW